MTVVDEESNPVQNHQVYITATTGAYTEALITSADGIVSTPANLSDGIYTIALDPREGYLMTAPITQEITDGDSIGVNVTLGIPFEPPVSGATLEGVNVDILVPVTVTVDDALLYYRNVGGGAFQSVPMVIIQQLDRPNPPGAGGNGTELDVEQVTYRGTIPPQVQSGTVTFYPEITLDDGSILGGIGTSRDVQILNIGLLYRLSVSPAVTETQIGVPYLFTVQAYDEFDGNLTADINAESDEAITWTAEGGSILDETDSHDQIVYLPEEEGDASITVRVNQPSRNALIEQTVPLINSFKILGSMSVTAALSAIPAGDSTELKITAIDTSGGLMRVDPEWEFHTTEMGTLRPIPFTDEAWFIANEGVFGRVPIIVRDKMTQFESELYPINEVEGESGLRVYIKLDSEPNRLFGGDNTAGMKVEGRFLSDAEANKTGQLYLEVPKLANVQRYSSTQESILERGYKLVLKGQVKEADIKYKVTLPIPGFARGRNPKIGRWDDEDVTFKVLGGVVAPDQQSMSIVFQGADLSVSGLFTLIAESEPLGIENLYFNPNPFSPEGNYPLSIEFTVHSEMQEQPWVTIEIFNMAGEHVRTLLDRVPMGKGYQHTRENDPVIWYGDTDDGRKARNGRYLVKIIAEDAKDRVEEVKTVVLIK